MISLVDLFMFLFNIWLVLRKYFFKLIGEIYFINMIDNENQLSDITVYYYWNILKHYLMGSNKHLDGKFYMKIFYDEKCYELIYTGDLFDSIAFDKIHSQTNTIKRKNVILLNENNDTISCDLNRIDQYYRTAKGSDAIVRHLVQKFFI